ncbi:MAG: glycosyltransferase [Eubacterium sp.]|nr:glycosyltransferase [Eubacterium sp.]
MRILLCNERFLFRFGVDRVLLLLGTYWKKAGHEIILMGNKMDAGTVEKCSNRWIQIPEADDYLHGNDFTLAYLKKHWDVWFTKEAKPDIAFIAGWPFYSSITFLRETCGYAVFHDYGAVPMDGMSESQAITQKELRRLRKEHLRKADRVIAISRYIEISQSRPDTAHKTATSHVCLGVDHLDNAVWQKEDLKMKQCDVLSDIRKLKARGYKLIFQPGRWEIGNYKNSAESFAVVEAVRRKGFLVKMLILSDKEEMGGIPEELEDCFYCMGHIDDATMKAVMEYADLGFSPTLWEGFDFPFGEMQYLHKHMYVFAVGAHPEVAAHPFFLCQSKEEAVRKICQDLSGTLPVRAEELEQALDQFCAKFTWKRCADAILRKMQKDMVRLGVVFLDVTNACHDPANSGVMRVTRKLARQLQQKVETVFVLWDDSIHQYVLPHDQELDLLCAYGGAERREIVYRSKEGTSRACMDDLLPKFGRRKKFLLFSETIDYKNMPYILSSMHAKQVIVAAIFYDAIPVLRPDLCSSQVSANHKQYMEELAFCDAVIPIAKHNERHLKNYWKKKKLPETLVRTVSLAGEMDHVGRNQKKIPYLPKRRNILFVSTLEPRKNHKHFLKAFCQLMEQQPQLMKQISLTMVGNRYAGNDEISKFVTAICKKYSNIKWLGVVEDTVLRRLYQECTFTVYPSQIEGYGMPIMESLWFGKPCLCSGQGSIGELGEPGGCCLTDVCDIEAMKHSLFRMLTDEAYLIHLQHEAVKREIVTWDHYADGILEVFSKTAGKNLECHPAYFSIGMQEQIKAYLEEMDTDQCIILCSNYYPPRFVGGAELIAHSQAKVLANDRKMPVIVFSLDVSGKYMEQYCYMEFYDGIPVVRFCIAAGHFHPDGVNFFHKGINEAFSQLCALVKPFVVHCHNMIGLSLGMIALAKQAGAKVCVTLHDHWGFCYRNTLLTNSGKLCNDIFACEACMDALHDGGIQIPSSVRQKYIRKALYQADILISPSRYLADSYIRAGFPYQRMRVLWNGVEVKKFATFQQKVSEKFRVSFIGHFGKHKGVETLIQAVSLLGRDEIEIELAGTGEELENYRKLASRLGILNQIRFWGKLENRDIIHVFEETDVYCLPSIWPENQPVSITEAMACGIPVIATDLGGNRELVRNGINGLLVIPNDAADLAAKIKILMDDDELRLSFGEAGKEIISRHDIKNQVAELIEHYKAPVRNKNSMQKYLAVKGLVVPNGITDLVDEEIQILDWLVLEEEYVSMKACIVLEGERLEEKEMKNLKNYGIPVVVPKAETGRYRKIGLHVIEYQNQTHLLEMVAAFGW